MTAPLGAELVRCPWCGAEPDSECRTPEGRAIRSHQARIVLSVLGDGHEAAVKRVAQILDETKKRVSTREQNQQRQQQEPRS